MKILKRILLFIALLALPVKANTLQDIYVIHFVLDGAQKTFLHEQIEKGELPNLKTHFFEQGAVFEKTLTTFPTVSSPGYISFATGLSAGNSSIFFLEWFDRTKQKVVGYLTLKGHQRTNTDLLNRLQLRDENSENLYSSVTLFEKLSPEPSASIYAPFRRGATITIPKKFPVRALWNAFVTKDGLMLNKLAMGELKQLFSKPAKKLPRYTLVGLYGTDFYGHHHGPQSKEISVVLKQFDSFFKEFVEQLKEKGILEKTYLILSSDHGMHSTGKVIKLRNALWKKGIRTGDKIYVGNRGVSSTFIYAAGEEGWEELPTLERLQNFPTKKGPIDLVRTLLELEEIDWLAVRESPDRVRIFNHAGEGFVHTVAIGNKSYYSYKYKGKDPLRFTQDPKLVPFLDGKLHPSPVWFEKTLESQSPNAVVELSHVFQDPRAGDILVMAKDSWSFRHIKAGTHGSINPDDMVIPLWISGPGIPQGKFERAKSVDLYPTVLNWFGILTNDDLKNQEGQVLFASNNAETTNDVVYWLAQLEQELLDKPPLFKLPNKEELEQRLKEMIPDGMETQVLSECQKEIDLRYARWKKLNKLQEKSKNPENPLAVPSPLRSNTEWLLANEKNIEFMRLRRMEDIKTILENP